MAIKRGRNFIYANSSIRVDGVPDSHKDWYPNALTLWNNHINWTQAKDYINSKCRGSLAGAKTIETTLNRLDKYTGLLAEDKVSSDDLAYGITQDLVNNLNQLNLGETTAISLLNYFFTAQSKTTAPYAGSSTAMNAGFSFESRLSEFIQRLTGETQFKGNAGGRLRTGANSVYAGESLMFYLGDHNTRSDGSKINIFNEKNKVALTKAILEDLNRTYKDFVSYIYEPVIRNINGKLEKDIAVVAYKVPSKIDITVPSVLTIKASYGPLVNHFLNVIRGARLSLKNSIDTDITLGSTNDNTRLRAFITQFANNLDKKFSTICTFIFASKKSGNTTVQRYLDWARILYELIGTGQTTTRGQKEDLLVDYLIINNYKNNSLSGGKVSVFNVKDLVNGFPDREYNPPFVIHGADKTGPVSLNLTKAINFSFS